MNASDQIKQWSYDLGFLACGIAVAEKLEEEAPRLEQWLAADYAGEMSYLNNWFEKRLDPTKLVPGAKSVISLLYNYYPSQELDFNGPKLSKYAYGKDYHKVVKKKLNKLLGKIREQYGDVQGRAFVDSAPVLEKAWAEKAGLGWRGKHSNLISPKSGSYFFLAELIIDLKLTPDHPFPKDHCGTCTRCIDACPTQAIVKPYVVDGSKCISYLTIELKGEMPQWALNHLDDWMFGCDVCQDVCPWNRFSKPHQEEKFLPNNKLQLLNDSELEELEKETFNEIFSGSAVKRTGYEGLMRNLKAIKKGP